MVTQSQSLALRHLFTRISSIESLLFRADLMRRTKLNIIDVAKKDTRAARLAMRDEQDLLNLADRAVRGLYDSVGMRSRLWLDATAKAHGSDGEAPEGELAQLRLNYVFFEMFYEKARLYGTPMVPFEKLRDVMLKVQRKKADEKENKENDQRILSNILRHLNREIEEISGSVAEEIGREKPRASDPDQACGARRREGA